LHEDQQYALEQLKSELAGNYQAIIIAGDIYDRAVPPPEAVELFGSFLNWVRERKLKAVIIPGNHDSPQRLGFADRALEESGVFIRCDYRRLTDPVRLDGPGGHQADIYALPFVETPWVREQLLRDDLVD